MSNSSESGLAQNAVNYTITADDDDQDFYDINIQLPKDKKQLYFLINSTESKNIKLIPLINVTKNLYDNFENTEYSLHTYHVSPNNLWINVDSGDRLVGVKKEANETAY